MLQTHGNNGDVTAENEKNLIYSSSFAETEFEHVVSDRYRNFDNEFRYYI